jgi:hypothetical protein
MGWDALVCTISIENSIYCMKKDEKRMSENKEKKQDNELERFEISGGQSTIWRW